MKTSSPTQMEPEKEQLVLGMFHKNKADDDWISFDAARNGNDSNTPSRAFELLLKAKFWR
jgi:hypothetical protein